MCDPVTAVAAIGTVVSAYGSYKSAQDQASAMRYNANSVEQQGLQNESDYIDQGKTKLAQQLAALSTRGVSIDSGTPLALMQASARNQAIDANRIRVGAQNQASGMRAQASQISSNALITAGGQVLMGASKLSSLGSIGGGSTGDAATVSAGSWTGPT